MLEQNNPNIDMGQLRYCLQQEISKQHEQIISRFKYIPEQSKKQDKKQEEPTQPFNYNPYRYEYTLSEVLSDVNKEGQRVQYNNRVFLKNAYWYVLRREIDPDGLVYYTQKLSVGMSRIECLLRLRLSSEGRIQGVRIIGLWSAFLEQKIAIKALSSIAKRIQHIGEYPLISGALQWFIDLTQLSYIPRRLRQCQEQIYRQSIAHTEDEIKNNQRDLLLATQEKKLEVQERRLETQEKILEAQQQALAVQEKHLIDQQQALAVQEKHLIDQQQALAVQEKHLIDQQQVLNLQQQRSQQQQSLLESRIASLTQELRWQEQTHFVVASEASNDTTATTPAAPALSNATALKQTQFYLAFENTFRGSKAVIRERLTAYLPLLDDLPSHATALDIGCGRGEWLSLLEEQGIQAQGIDVNSAMIKSCEENHLLVKQADALAYLMTLEKNSIDLITAFHVIEHIPFAQVIELFDSVLQVLKPHGMIIFETPNPENIQVGSCSFYHDPSHNNPLPPMLIEFLAQHRGYDQVQIQRINPYPSDLWVPEKDSIAAEHINRYFYSAQDYALIARKKQ